MNTKTPPTVRLTIDDMSCRHCVGAVLKALSTVPGVTVKSVAIGSAVIEAASAEATAQAVAALEDAGYTARATAESAGTGTTGCSCCGTGSAEKSPRSTSGGCC